MIFYLPSPVYAPPTQATFVETRVLVVKHTTGSEVKSEMVNPEVPNPFYYRNFFE